MATPVQIFKDGILALDGGMNAGVMPQLLPPNQTAFSINATHRGGFVTQRPSIKKINLTFESEATRQIALHSFFQGASFYQPDLGDTQLIASLGGKLISFSPDSDGNAFVTNISIPGDPNPSTAVQAWLWQAEKWLIVNDGQSLPLFYDGTTTRRSLGPSKLLATVAAPFFTSPAVGLSVQATLSADYPGPFNVNIEVVKNGAAATYTILPAGQPPASVNAVLTTIFDPGTGTAIAAGASLLSIPSRVGISSWGGSPSPAPSGAPNPPNNQQVDVYAFPAPTPGTWNVGPRIFKVTKVVADSIDPNLFHAYGQNCTTITKVQTGTDPRTNAPIYGNLPCSDPAWSTSGEAVTRNISTANALVGKVVTPFTTPTIGGSVSVVLDSPYTGSGNKVVYIGNVMYLISQVTPAAPSPTVTLVNVNDAVGTVYSATTTIQSIAELPPGRMGTYGLGRNWVSLVDGRSYVAGDIVGGSSGTALFNFRDSVLRFTENSYLAGGGAFIIPGNVGDIRFMRFTSTLDASLGQGPLQIGTPYSIFSCNAPVNRVTTALALGWQDVTNPIQTQSLIGNGGLSQNGSIVVNGDIIMRSIDGIRSLILARRDFSTWGNVPQSEEVQALLDMDNTALLQYASAIQFDNRLMMTALPSNSPVGVVHQAVALINFDPISSLRGKADSIYDGVWTGVNVLQFISGINNGTQRAFAFAYSSSAGEIELWEIMRSSDNLDFDNESTPILWSFESASLFKIVKGKGVFDLVELIDGEIYVSDIRGVVSFQAWYRPDYSPCWQKWVSFKVCADNVSDSSIPKQQRTRLGLGEPDIADCDPTNNRPYRMGHTFQVRFQISGSCKFMGASFTARSTPDQERAKIICDAICEEDGSIQPCEPCKSFSECIQFPIVFYNFSLGKTYTNSDLTVDVVCPDGNVVKSYVPANTVFFSLPYPPGYSGEYPPLILNCAAGGSIVRTIPPGSSQDDIDIIVNEMVNTCATEYAKLNAPCPTTAGAPYPPGGPVAPSQVGNGIVYFSKACGTGTVLTYTLTLPPWITLDATNQRLIGAAGAFTSTSQADADQQAQAALDAFANDAITNGTLYCKTPPDLDWESLVWTLTNARIGEPCIGDDTHYEHGSVFTNSIYANTDGRCSGLYNSSSVQALGLLTYTGPQINCVLEVVVSGCTGNPDAGNTINVGSHYTSAGSGLLIHVPFVDGTYTYPFFIPNSTGTMAANEISVNFYHASTYTVGGGSKWACKLKVV